MEYQRKRQSPQPYGGIQASQLDAAYAAGLLGCEPHNFLSNLPPHQVSQFSTNQISNSASSDNLVEGYTWPAQGNELDFLATGLVDPLLEIQQAAQVQNTVAERSDDEQDWRQAVARLEDGMRRLEEKSGGLEVVIKGLQDDIEEKTRFYTEVEKYIKLLVEWTRNSKEAIDSLVAELKEAVKLANSK